MPWASGPCARGPGSSVTTGARLASGPGPDSQALDDLALRRAPRSSCLACTAAGSALLQARARRTPHTVPHGPTRPHTAPYGHHTAPHGPTRPLHGHHTARHGPHTARHGHHTAPTRPDTARHGPTRPPHGHHTPPHGPARPRTAHTVVTMAAASGAWRGRLWVCFKLGGKSIPQAFFGRLIKIDLVV